MDFLYPHEELLFSYKRCSKMGIDPSITASLIMLKSSRFRNDVIILSIANNKEVCSSFKKQYCN